MRLTSLGIWVLTFIVASRIGFLQKPGFVSVPEAVSATSERFEGTDAISSPAGTQQDGLTISGSLLDENIVYLPLVIMPGADIEITNAWIGNQDGIALSTFLPGTQVEYIVSGINHLREAATVDFGWSQIGPCGSGQIITKSLTLNPGLWVDVVHSSMPDCIGSYTATARIKGDDFHSSQTVKFRVDTASVVISDKQGFDRCNMPSISEMQTWWDTSPYYVANIYLGGISFDNTQGCSNENIDANWMQSVASQGWGFLLAWVGPQAPCSGYSYKMSSNSLVSYQEGRSEAESAIQAAADIGLASSIIVYYDIEGYGNASNKSCRAAVDAFLTGWTERLHELGARSGAYGSPCNSHVSDWVDNDPPPDNVWLAHWVDQNFNPDATVWDLACISNNLWSDHQRVRQYAGDHTETWGGLSLRIDSNVLDGEVVVLEEPEPAWSSLKSKYSQVMPDIRQQQYLPEIRDLGLSSRYRGWVLIDDRLLVTQDGGASWEQLSLPFSAGEIATGSLKFNSEGEGRLDRRLSTGSSFNLVREFTTQDGGGTWQGGEIFTTPIVESEPRLHLGGLNLPEGVILLDWIDQDTAWALSQQSACQGTKIPIWDLNRSNTPSWECMLQTRLWMTVDGGLTWRDISPQISLP